MISYNAHFNSIRVNFIQGMSMTTMLGYVTTWICCDSHYFEDVILRSCEVDLNERVSPMHGWNNFMDEQLAYGWCKVMDEWCLLVDEKLHMKDEKWNMVDEKWHMVDDML